MVSAALGGRLDFPAFLRLAAWGVQWFLASNRQQRRQPGKACGGQREDLAGPHPLHAAIGGLRRAADGLGPAEELIDPLPVLLRQGITLVPRLSSVDRREPRLLRLHELRGFHPIPFSPSQGNLAENRSFKRSSVHGTEYEISTDSQRATEI